MVEEVLQGTYNPLMDHVVCFAPRRVVAVKGIALATSSSVSKAASFGISGDTVVSYETVMWGDDFQGKEDANTCFDMEGFDGKT